MNYRKLGKTGFEISEIGYGAWGIGGSIWIGAKDDESQKALHRTIDLGLNFIDTALAYGDGHSEVLVGEVVRQRSERIYVASKVPPKNMLWPARPGIPLSQAFPYDYVTRCVDRSLKNLKFDTIDLMQFHVWNPDWNESDDWKRAVEDLKRAGKVRHFGISINDYQPDTVLDTLRLGLIDAVQVIYNIFDPRAQDNLFPLCRELNIGVIARVPLDEGGLTGRIKPGVRFPDGDFRTRYFKDDRPQQVFDHVSKIEKEVGEGYLPIAELALRFCLSAPEVSTVIPGMRSVRNAELNMAVSGKGPLPADVLAKLAKQRWIRDFYVRPG
jgi:aryl-alcohol dehydrogenase-like predicted oxidoreductase